MGEEVSFGSLGGYLTGDGPGAVVVLHEWAGLVAHIRDVADRVAAAGFTALAADLYDGESAEGGDDAEAARLQGRILRDTGAAAARIASGVAWLRGRGHSKVALLGFCTGASLSLLTSALYPIDATVAYYGIFTHRSERNIPNPVLIHLAEREEFYPPADQFLAWFSGMSNVEIHVYPGTLHAFFNDTVPSHYDRDAASLSWDRTISFLQTHLAV